jgi:hypothetical protein
LPADAIPLKRDHDPPDGPEQSDERGDARGGREKRHPVLELAKLDCARPQERAIDRVQALQRWTPRRRCPAWPDRSSRSAAACSAPRSRTGTVQPAGWPPGSGRLPAPRRTSRSCERRRERRRLPLGRRNDQILEKMTAQEIALKIRRMSRDQLPMIVAVRDEPDDIGASIDVAGPSHRRRALRSLRKRKENAQSTLQPSPGTLPRSPLRRRSRGPVPRRSGARPARDLATPGDML